MYGGTVAYAGNLVDQVSIIGRVSAAGAILVPTRVPKFTVTHTGSSGIYDIAFGESYPVFGGAGITLELTGIPGSAATNVSTGYQWTAATRTLRVYTFNNSATPAATDNAFSFEVVFAESVGP